MMRALVAIALVAACGKSAPPPCTDVATCKAACAGHDAASCEKLGKLSLRAKPVDLAGAATAYEQACNAGRAAACAALALQVQDGRGVSWDQARAVELYRRACDGGAGVGCFNLAIMYNEGNGLPHDRAKAEAMMARAFELYTAQCPKDPQWCVNIGFLHESGMVGSAGPDFAKAAEADRKGCDLGDPDACASFARLQLDGSGMPQDRTAASAALDKLCTAGNALGCALLGHSLFAGDTVPPRAAELIVKGCELGNAEACATAAALYGIGRGVAVDDAKSYEYGLRGCDLGDSLACVAQGAALEQSRPSEAQDFYFRACRYGNREGCERGCRLGDRRACDVAGQR